MTLAVGVSKSSEILCIKFCLGNICVLYVENCYVEHLESKKRKIYSMGTRIGLMGRKVARR